MAKQTTVKHTVDNKSIKIASGTKNANASKIAKFNSGSSKDIKVTGKKK